ncbi:MAG: HesB/IscA family protein [Candidatus Kariarchaeaceae archaeon]|jgi:iron-sulfur cluster assembly accessory protein
MVLDQETKTETSFVTISEGALSQVKSVIAQQKQENLFLRIFVQGGCGGISYGMAIDMRKQPDDTEFTIEGLPVVVDRISHQYVEGATVEYDETGEKKGFRISNPSVEEQMSQAGGCASGSCGTVGGCGTGTGGCC